MSTAALPATIWQRELVEFVGRRRALAIKLAFPLLVAIPLLFSRAPTPVTATALTMLAAIIGAVGAGAVLTRDRLIGLSARYRLLPRRPAAILVERLGAGAAIDLLQMIVVLVLVAVRYPHNYAFWPALLFTTAGVLAVTNALGAWASTLTTSPGEVMLIVLVPLLPALYLSGVFTPVTLPGLAAIGHVLPFAYLHDALLGSLSAGPAQPPWIDALGGLVFVLVAAITASLLGARVLEQD